MLPMILQHVACALILAIFTSVASAGAIYQDPAGKFRMPLPDGWTVERRPMPREVCEGTATDIRSGRDPITQLNVLTCAFDLDPVEAGRREIERMAQTWSEQFQADDNAVDVTQLQRRLLEELCRPFFRGHVDALREAGRLETSGKVNRTMALGRDAMRSDFTFYPKKDGKRRLGFAVYLHGDRTSYFFAVTSNDQEYPAAAQMFEATEITR